MPLKFFQPRRTTGGVHLTGVTHADDVGEGLRQLVCAGDILATDIQFSEGVGGRAEDAASSRRTSKEDLKSV
jgi:hypothetical protein